MRDVGFERADDPAVRHDARDRGFVMVAKDSDFNQMSSLHSEPPKVVWLRAGNCTTDRALELILGNAPGIVDLADEAFLVVNSER